ncbi:MAG: SpoIIE family protein phosphatase, partial [Gaiella sp.]
MIAGRDDAGASRPSLRLPGGSGRQLFVLVALIVAVAVAVGSIWGVRAYQQAKRDALASISMQVAADRRAASRFVLDRIEFLRSIASVEPVLGGNRVRIRSFLRAVSGRRAVFDDIGWVAPTGAGVVLPQLPVAETAAVDLSSRDYVRAVRETRRPYVSAGLAAAIAADPVMVLAVPAIDGGGRLRGIVTGVVDLSVLRSPSEALRFDPTQSALIDRAGQVIVASTPITRLQPVRDAELLAQLRARSSGVLTDGRGLDGDRDQVLAFASVPEAGWIVTRSRSQGAVFAEANAALASRLATWLSFAVLTLLGAWWFARRVDRAERAGSRRVAALLDLSVALAAAVAPAQVVRTAEQRLRSALRADEALLCEVVQGRILPMHHGTDDRAPQWLGSAGAVIESAVSTSSRAWSVGRKRRSESGRASGGLIAVAAVPLPAINSGSPQTAAVAVGFRSPTTLGEDDWQLLEIVAETVGQALARADLLERERQTNLGLRTLQELSSRLTSADTPREVALHTVGAVRRVFEPRACSVGVVDGETMQVAAATWFSPDGEVAWSEIAPPSDAVRTVGELDRHAAPGTAPRSSASTPGAEIVEPLGRDRGRIVLELEQRHELARYERELLEAVARLATESLERIALRNRDALRRKRVGAVQNLALTLSTVRGAEEIAAAVRATAQDAVDATCVVLAIVREDGTIGHHVDPARGDDELRLWGDAAADDRTLAADAIRSGLPVVVADAERLDRTYPDASRDWARAGLGAAVAVPVGLGAARPLGALICAWPAGFSPDDETVATIELLTRRAVTALAAVRQREHDERARFEAELSADVLTELESVTGYRQRLERLVEVLVPRVADYATIEAPRGAQRLLALAHRDRDKLPVLRALRERFALQPDDPRSVARAADGAAQLLSEITPETMAEVAPSPATRALLERLAPRSHLAVPLTLETGPPHDLVLMLGISDPGRQPFTTRDLETIRALAGRAAAGIESARLLDYEHGVAVRLQEALLPDRLVEHPRVALTARYRPGDDRLEVGGDWYETVSLPDGRIAIAVGDIVGHGLPAAAAMGRLRTGFVALAPSSASPASLLEQLDDFAVTIPAAEFSTVCCLFLDPEDGTCEYASAGHPPLLFVDGEGAARFLEEGRSWPLCSPTDRRRPAGASARLAAGDTIVLYSDGLIERRGERLGVGLERLRLAVERLGSVSVERLCDELVDELTGAEALEDDVVVLAVRRQPAPVVLLSERV